MPRITPRSAAVADAIGALRSRTREVRGMQERTGGLVAPHPAVVVA